MKWAENFQDLGPASITPPINQSVIKSFDFGTTEATSLMSGHEFLAQSIRNARSKDYIQEAYAVAEMVTGQETGKLLGITIKRGKDAIQIPIVDPQTNMVRAGENWMR